MEEGVRDAIDVTSDDGAVPDGHIVADEDLADHGGIGSHEEKAFVEEVEVVEVHDAAGLTEGLAVFAWSLQPLCREGLEQSPSQHTCK